MKLSAHDITKLEKWLDDNDYESLDAMLYDFEKMEKTILKIHYSLTEGAVSLGNEK